MITVTGTLTCATEAEAALVRAHLPEHIRLTRAEPGCLRFSVTQADDPLVWHLDESFTDRAAFEAHVARTRASQWAGATQGVARDLKISGD